MNLIKEYFMEIVMIIAVILGPIAAVQVDRIIEQKRSKKARKLSVFKTLMTTRSISLSYPKVEALNSIDIEFTEHAKVIESWKNYANLLKNQQLDDNTFSLKEGELYIELIVEMGKVVGYNLSKADVERNSYYPKGLAEFERNQRESVKMNAELYRAIKAPTNPTNDKV